MHSNGDSDDGHSSSVRGCNPCCSVCAGIVLFFAGIGLLGWNERRTVCMSKALYSAEAVAVRADCNVAPTSYYGKLVFLSCPLNQADMKKYDATSADSSNIGLKEIIKEVRGLCFEHRIRIYQCREIKETFCETKDKNGRCTRERTNFRYQLEYSSEYLDSSKFYRKKDSGHISNSAKQSKERICGAKENPQHESLPYPVLASASRPDSVEMGAWQLNRDQVHVLTAECNTSVHLNRDALKDFTQSPTQPPIHLDGVSMRAGGSESTLYSCNYAAESVGCIAMNFYTLTPEAVSLLYQLTESGFAAYNAPSSWLCGGEEISHIVEGRLELDVLFEDLHSTEKLLRWGLRVLGFFTIFAGLYMVFSPIEWLASKIPFIGDFVADVASCMIAFVAGVIAIAVTLVTIGIVWVVMRPLLGICLLLAGIIIVAAVICFGRKKKNEKENVVRRTTDGKIMPSSAQMGVETIDIEDDRAYGRNETC